MFRNSSMRSLHWVSMPCFPLVPLPIFAPPPPPHTLFLLLRLFSTTSRFHAASDLFLVLFLAGKDEWKVHQMCAAQLLHLQFGFPAFLPGVGEVQLSGVLLSFKCDHPQQAAIAGTLEQHCVVCHGFFCLLPHFFCPSPISSFFSWVLRVISASFHPR